MNEQLAIIEIWIKSSKSIQEIETKSNILEKRLERIKNEAKMGLLERRINGKNK